MEQTDWEQVRIQAAIAAMQELIRDVCPEFADIKVITETSVQLADALIEELKKEK